MPSLSAMPMPLPIRRLAEDRSGLALLEFAFALPLVLTIGLYAIENANLALTNLRVSQIALNLADNASRVGMMTSNNGEQLREIDVNDVLAATRIQGAPLDLTTRGRVTLSSLEEHNGKQMIHWQRCLGTAKPGYDSSYGTTKVDDGTDTDPNHAGKVVTGMGDSPMVTAPDDAGVMFVEVNYLYKPVVTMSWLPSSSIRIHYTASFIVRDRRMFDQIYNPDPKPTRMTCDLYTA